MAFVEGKIVFAKLTGFPVLCENSKIQTKCFIDGAREVVSLIEEFGTLFHPVVYDMSGNIQKIATAYAENTEQNYYLEDLLTHELKKTKSATIDSLLWLKRALELLQQFFRNVLEDSTLKENLKDHLQDAYTKSLKPYHGFFVQTAFSVVYRFIPNRSQLIGKQEENLKNLEIFLNPLRSHLMQINLFYIEHNLDHQIKINSI